MKGQTLSLKTKVDVTSRMKEIERAHTVTIDHNTHLNRCYILIGLPCSGRSYWVNSVLRCWRGIYPALLCEDDLIEEECRKTGEDYDTVVARSNMADLRAKVDSLFHQALGVNRDIIVDRPNLSRDDRGLILDRLPEYYQRVAVFFQMPQNLILSRLQARSKKTGRVYSPSLIQTMSRRLEMPDLNEFHRITIIDQHCVF